MNNGKYVFLAVQRNLTSNNNVFKSKMSVCLKCCEITNSDNMLKIHLSEGRCSDVSIDNNIDKHIFCLCPCFVIAIYYRDYELICHHISRVMCDLL